MERHLATLEELQGEARTFAESLAPRTDRATLVTLSGDLGAGKTSFAQGVAAALGVTHHVTSPTFVLERLYPLSVAEGRGFSRLAHLDAYRLDGPEALMPLGFQERMSDPTTLILLEWPETVGVSEADVRIALKVDGDGRTISYTYGG
jgi:tRNA threonylcarbamoyl adenosine modification protein YjeE